MEAFSLSRTVATERPAVGLDTQPQGDFAVGLRRLPRVDTGADFATGMRTQARRSASGHFATGQSWHPQPYVGRGDFAVGMGRRRRVASVTDRAPQADEVGR